MKKYFLFLAVAIASALTFSLESCKEDDPCEEVICQNGSVCDNGNCICEEDYFGELCEYKCVRGTFENGVCDCSKGYEGVSCEDPMRAQYIGTWNASETCQGQSNEYTYSVGIAENEDDILQVEINNFRDDNDEDPVVLLIDRDDKNIAVIEEQPFGAFALSGDASFNEAGDSLTVTYKATNSNGVENCTIIFTK